MSDTESQIAELKKQVRNAERQHRYYQKQYGAAGGLSMFPYQKLAAIYRERKDYRAEVKLLERFFQKNGAGYPQEVTGGMADMLKRLEGARELLEAQERFGPDSKGQCQVCSKGPLKLAKTKTGQWVCSRCKRELEPPRPKHLATEKAIASARRLGFKVPDDATKEKLDRIFGLHGTVTDYVKDVWHMMTGQRAPMQTGSLSLPQFVTGLFRDQPLIQRIAAIQRGRNAAAERKMTPEEKGSPDAYKHLRRNKPPVPQDADSQFVAQGLKARFTPAGAVGDLRVDLTQSKGFLSDLASFVSDKLKRTK